MHIKQAMNLIQKYQPEIQRLCKKHAVQSLYVFGSVLQNNFTPHSDIDLLVEFDWENDCDFSNCYWELKTELESLFDRKVDLVCDSAIRNPIFRRKVDAHKEAVYAV